MRSTLSKCGFLGGLIQHVFFVVFIVFCQSGKSIAALTQCPSAINQQITSPCKFLPGSHNYETLTITSDVYLETDHLSCEHVFNVTQGFIIKSSATIFVGFCEKISGAGNGVGASSGGSGASHGGRGGTASFQVFSAAQAPTYGSAFNVLTHGSRGGGKTGGRGGGFLQILAEKLTLNGVIRAVGENAGADGGGGSGGGVSIVNDRIEGSGRIEVFGGLGAGQGGGGAGGRASVISQIGIFKGLAHAFGGKTSKYMFMIIWLC